MGVDSGQRHLPGLLKQQNKMHKHGRHRSKGAIEKMSKGKMMSLLQGPSRQKQRQEMSREERRNRANQIRQKKRFEYLQKRRGVAEGPILVAIIPLHAEINVNDTLAFIKKDLGESAVTETPEKHIHISNPIFKEKFSLVTCATDNMYDRLDVLKVADTVLFLASVKGLDGEGRVTLTTAISQGLPSSLVTLVDIDTLPLKKWHEGKTKLAKELERWFPEEKILTLSKTGDGLQLFRRIANQKEKTVQFRKYRPNLIAEKVDFIETSPGKGMLTVTGFLRCQNLSANSLVHIPGWGEFQISQIDSAPVPGEEGESKVIDTPDLALQETLDSENHDESTKNDEQTWPTQEDMDLADEDNKRIKKLKKVPKGFSEYQAAWIPDADTIEVEELSEEEDDENKMEAEDEEESDEGDSEEEEDDTATVISEGPIPDEKYDNQMDLDEEKSSYEKVKRAKEDAEFPDEVDTPRDVPAKVRFQKYRGLLSFRTSPWDVKENLPPEYLRIFQFENYKRAKSLAVSHQIQTEGAKVGDYINLHIKDVPVEMFHLRGLQPIVVFGMLQHEQKMSLLNLVLQRCADSTEPIQSKEPLVFQVGYRRFKACPIFSAHTNGNKHKYERFFQPESIVVASVFAPIMFSPAPVLAFKEDKDGTLSLIATGTVLSNDPNRVVVKRAVLSGHPFKVLKRSAVIRFMFFNREDILWFKPIELRTKYGRRGHIKEPLGTHGHMKCVFNAQLKSQDTVLMNLYKRVFPKWTYDPKVTFSIMDVPYSSDSHQMDTH